MKNVPRAVFVVLDEHGNATEAANNKKHATDKAIHVGDTVHRYILARVLNPKKEEENENV